MVYQYIERIGTTPSIRAAAKLLLLTLVRKSELTNATWSELNFSEALWTIPKERMKRRNSHVVYLSQQALDIFIALKTFAGGSEYVLPSRYDSDRALVISGTVGAFMNGPNFLTIASWFQKNIREVFDPAYPRSPDGYPLALTDRANWMLYTEMYAFGIRTGKVKVDGARGIVTIIADKMIIVTEIPEDQQTPFMGRKGSTGGGGDGEIGGSGGRVGSVKIYGPAP